METFNVASFLFALVLMLLGAVAHWVHRKIRGEARGNIVDYFIADYPGRSASVLVVLLGSSTGIAMTELSGLVDPRVLWPQLLETGSIPLMCAAAIGACLTHGWTFDSGINKGGKGDGSQ